jgi:uncharacterized protein (UPF0261 family)
MSVLLFATLDTKGREADSVRAELVRLGVQVELVDTGCIGAPQVRADVSREELFRAAGTTLEALLERKDRGVAVDSAAEGARALALERHARGTLDGVMALGGSAGTTIGTAAMRALPLGVPKLMVSTLASGQVAPFVGTKDVLMMHSVVDILGLNRISRLVLARAAQAMAGMVQGQAPPPEANERPLIAASMFGVTTPCVERAREVLEAAGYEVLVFHATGSGGRTLESLVADGLIAGVLDITTTELADELVGGVLSAGPERLTAAARAGVPQVVSVGAVDMVNFFAPDTVPARFADRKFHHHNANVTLMRTTPDECASIGRDLGTKLGSSRGPVRILLPARGVSAIDREGQSFDDPKARRALFDAISSSCGDVPVTELDLHINERAFAEAAANALVELLRSHAAERERGQALSRRSP